MMTEREKIEADLAWHRARLKKYPELNDNPDYAIHKVIAALEELLEDCDEARY